MIMVALSYKIKGMDKVSSVNLKIAELRKSKGIGQQELANVMGVSFQLVSKWKNRIKMQSKFVE